ncbi:MAG: BREX system Lon protease-like protein BrxL [Bacteroidales bacterium]|nr:BREX system Lon protease-like protein BrxL [Bacteroidales bacterium]
MENIAISQKTKEVFPELSIMKARRYDSLFKGRNLPSFVRDYILRRFTNNEGVVDEKAVKEYLNTKMPSDSEILKQRLLNGESVNITTRFTVSTDMALGRVRFHMPDVGISSSTYVSQELLEKSEDPLTDGEHWGNITLLYVEPQGKRKGYALMTSYKAFEPYRIDLSYYLEARSNFTTEEWIDFLIAAMEYNPEEFSEEQKHEIIARLLPLVEPRLNMIELGPKGTGKSYVYNNLSKHAWLLAGGRTTRAKLFYNKATKQFGVMKNYDVVGIDEITTFQFSDPDEMQSIMKSYLEAGKAAVDNVMFQSECGLMLMGNIPLDKDMKPLNPSYAQSLPEMFRESATMDRFHGFIEGWRLPRLSKDHIIEGWVLNCEYFSSVLHILRFSSEYDRIFTELVDIPHGCDLRDKKAVQRLATAYHKLLFPHIRSLADIEPDQVDTFKLLYDRYCLQPAIYRRQIIRDQCHRIDKEFKPEVSEFSIVDLPYIEDIENEPVVNEEVEDLPFEDLPIEEEIIEEQTVEETPEEEAFEEEAPIEEEVPVEEEVPIEEESSEEVPGVEDPIVEEYDEEDNGEEELGEVANNLVA